MNLNNLLQISIPEYIVSIIIWLGIFIWIWSVLWTTKDISARTSNIFLQVISILLVAGLTPIFWLPLYILIRPIYYKYEKFWWRESLLLKVITCPNCGEANNKNFNNCIYCWTKLTIKCKECKKEFPCEYEFCPNCWAPNIEIK